MKKTLKYSIIILLVLVIALLAAPFFVDVDDYKVAIEHEVEDATGRKLHIGEISASLFPWVGVTLKDVEFANRPGFSDQAFLKVKSLDVQVELLPLLNKEVMVKRFELDAPQIVLERNAAGDGNWMDLTGAPVSEANETVSPHSGPSAGKGSEAPALAALSAQALSISNGSLIWRDAKPKQDTSDEQPAQQIQVSELNVQLNDVQLERPIDVDVSMKVAGDTLQLNGRIGAIGDLAKLDVNRLPLQLHVLVEQLHLNTFASFLPPFPEMLGDASQATASADVKIEQRPDGVKVLAGSAGLKSASALDLSWKLELLSSDRAQIKSLDVSLDGQHLLALEGELQGLAENHISYEMRLVSDALNRQWLAGYVSALDEMYQAHPDPWKTIKIGALVGGNTSSVSIKDMQLQLNQDVVQGTGRIGFAEAPDIRLRLSGQTLHLDPWLPQPGETPAANTELSAVNAPAVSTGADKTQATEPDLRFLKPWKLNIQAKFSELNLRGLELKDFGSTISGNDGVIKLDPMRFSLSGGQVEENTVLNAAVYPARWQESIHITNVKVGPVLKVLADTELLDGTMKLDTNIRATGLLPENAKRSLNGKAQLTMTDGRIKGFDIAGAIRNIQALGQSSGPQYTDFAQLQASFNIRNGVADNKDLFMASPLFRLTGQGVIDLVGSTLDYHVRPKLIGSLVGQGDTVATRKGIEIPLHIKGPFAAPSVKPELDKKAVVDTVGGALKSGAKPKDIIKSLMGGGQGNEAAPANQQDAPSQQPTEKPALPKPADALKGLFGL